MRKMIAGLVCTLVFGFTAVASAQTIDVQAQIAALLQQIAALQQQLSGLQQPIPSNSVPIPMPNPIVSLGACPVLTRNLGPGASGPDVANLQRFLAGDPSIYPEGTVSGYYGGLTRAAVEHFQAKYGVVSGGSPETTGYGAVGPATRAAISRACTSNGSIPGTPTPAGAVSCYVGTTAMASGIAMRFYSITAAPTGASCDQYAQVRSCANGVVSGQSIYQYASCLEPAQQTCTVGAIVVPNNSSRTFFSRPRVDVGQSCNNYAEIRSCTSGVMSGSSNFTYPNCSVDTPDSCVISGITIASGSSRTFYSRSTATSTSCSVYSQTRTCNDGVLSGDAQYSQTSCSAGACEIDGITLANGSTTSFYLAQNIPATEQCSSYVQQRTCNSGIMNGTSAYKYHTCTPAPSGTCVLDSVVLSNGSSATFYSTSTAPGGAACTSYRATRTCSGGVLSGSSAYNRASCIDTQSCSLNGVVLPHGSSTTFYSALTVPFGTTCSSKALTRTCVNGAFSGNTAYQYPNCSVNPPTSMLRQQLASALVALEGALETILAWFQR